MKGRASIFDRTGPATSVPNRSGLLASLLVLILLAAAPTAWSQQPQPEAPQPSSPHTDPAQSSPAQSSPAQNNPIPTDSVQTATLRGTVTDKDGAVYQGAHVTLSISSASPAIGVTDANGHFEFPNLAPGAFQLTVSSAGFATQTVTGSLSAGDSQTLPTIVLPFATATTEVSVTASTLEVAEAEIKEEEQQRVFGVVPNFYVAYGPNPAPLSSKQKFSLAFRSSFDPVTFLTSGFIAGIEQADGDFSGYGQGTEGYAKRFAANYADTFIDSMLGSAILPSLLKQDPRYFYKGTGTIRARALYAMANAVITKSDKGQWQPNYSGIIGGLATGGISNLYYPSANRNGLSVTFENAAYGIVTGAAQNLFQEFLVRKLTPKARKNSSSSP